eukprot:gene7758-biopygen14336
MQSKCTLSVCERIGILITLPNWVENLIVIQTTSVFMMAPVAEFPWVVGGHDEGVENISDDVVQQTTSAEAAVAAIVTEYENCPEICALDEGVNNPKAPEDRCADGLGVVALPEAGKGVEAYTHENGIEGSVAERLPQNRLHQRWTGFALSRKT